MTEEDNLLSTVVEPDDEEAELFKAMSKAKQAFYKHFEDEGMDGAYWEIYLEGWVLGSNFNRMQSLKMDESETKRGEE